MSLANEFFVGTAGGISSPTILAQARQRTAGGIYMAKLGDFMFSLDTSAFQSLQRQTGYRWQAVKRIGRSSAQQFTGLDDDTIELQGVVFPHFRGGLSQVGLMRAAAGGGKPLPLIYAFESMGQYCGPWCIRSITEGRTEFTREGFPKRIEFSLSLVAYGEDAGAAGTGLLSFSGAAASAIPASLQTPISVAAGTIASLPLITASSQVPDVNRVAASLQASGDATMAAITEARATVQAALSSMTPSVSAVIPSAAMQSAKSLVTTATASLDAWRETSATIGVVQDSPADVRNAARQLRTLAETGRDLATVAGGGVASYYAAAAGQPHDPAVGDVDRITAAASMGNVSRSADSMLAAYLEAAEQAAAIMETIDV